MMISIKRFWAADDPHLHHSPPLDEFNARNSPTTVKKSIWSTARADAWKWQRWLVNYRACMEAFCVGDETKALKTKSPLTKKTPNAFKAMQESFKINIRIDMDARWTRA